MIKATAKGRDGRDVLLIGLSFGNLKKFREEPGDTYIKIQGEQLGLPIDVVIFSGETELDMTKQILPMLSPDAKTKRQEN